MTNQENGNSYYDAGSTKPKEVTDAVARKLAERSKLTNPRKLLVIALVGLPGRGKSFIGRKLQAYMSWHGTPCKIFNVGMYRRDANAEHQQKDKSEESKDDTDLGACDANFFDPKNVAAKKLREEVAMLALRHSLKWLDSTDDLISEGDEGKIVIFDATNSTNNRRERIVEECTKFENEIGQSVGVIFLESVCDDEELLEDNYRMKISVSPDYKGMPEEEAMADVRDRVRKYEEAYETLDDDSLSYIKLFNFSSKLLANQIYGHMSRAVVPALSAWHIGQRPIYLCRAAMTESKGRAGTIDIHGRKFRDALSKYFYGECVDFAIPRHEEARATNCLHQSSSIYIDRKKLENDYLGKILCSTMPRSVETATWDDKEVPMDILSNLNPLDKGEFNGMELHEMEKLDPTWHAKFLADPYNTRYPGGECYRDLINRLESCVIDMEQQVVPVLVVSHLSVIQVLLSYFRNTTVAKSSSVQVPMHTVIRLDPVGGGSWKETQICLRDMEETFNDLPQSVNDDETPFYEGR